MVSTMISYSILELDTLFTAETVQWRPDSVSRMKERIQMELGNNVLICYPHDRLSNIQQILQPSCFLQLAE